MSAFSQPAEHVDDTQVPSRIEPVMYRFFHMDAGNRIAQSEDHKCRDNRSALALGKEMWLASTHPKVEVWHHRQRVGVLDKDLLF